MIFRNIDKAMDKIAGIFSKSIDYERPSTWAPFFGNSKKSGAVIVTEESAMTFSAVYACIHLITDSIAALPKNVYTKTKEGREVNRAHDQYYLLKAAPNDYSTASTYWKGLIAQALLTGNGFAEIIRNENTGRPVKYRLIPSKSVTPFWSEGDLFFKDWSEDKIISAANMIHLPYGSTNGVFGKSPIAQAKDNIAMGISATQYGSKFYENGTHLGGAIKLKGSLKDQAAVERLRGSWKDKYGGMDKVGQIAVLEDDSDFEPFGMTQSDAQFIESRKFQVVEIARIFGVPPHMIGDLDRSTNNNINHQSIEFVQRTLLPIIVALEQEVNRKAFRVREYGETYFKIEQNGLLRGDLATRALWYKTLYYTGSIRPNEIRALEDFNSYEEGNEFFVPTNMIPASMVEEFFSDKEDKLSNDAWMEKMLKEKLNGIKPQFNGNGKN